MHRKLRSRDSKIRRSKTTNDNRNEGHLRVIRTQFPVPLSCRTCGSPQQLFPFSTLHMLTAKSAFWHPPPSPYCESASYSAFCDNQHTTEMSLQQPPQPSEVKPLHFPKKSLCLLQILPSHLAEWFLDSELGILTSSFFLLTCKALYQVMCSHCTLYIFAFSSWHGRNTVAALTPGSNGTPGLGL